MLSSDKITKIFFVIDEFCKNFSEVPVIGRYLPSFFFNDYEDTDMAHELLHNMGLPHTFQGKTPKKSGNPLSKNNGESIKLTETIKAFGSGCLGNKN